MCRPSGVFLWHLLSLFCSSFLLSVSHLLLLLLAFTSFFSLCLCLRLFSPLSHLPFFYLSSSSSLLTLLILVLVVVWDCRWCCLRVVMRRIIVKARALECFYASQARLRFNCLSFPIIIYLIMKKPSFLYLLYECLIMLCMWRDVCLLFRSVRRLPSRQ